MKKLALTSLLAVFAVSGAHAANVIDGNPLYMPKAGHFYSVTTLASHSENSEDWMLGEEFGYGVTDKLAINLETTLSEENWFDDDDDKYDAYGWDDFSLKATFRAFQDGNWVADVYGTYGVDHVYPYKAPFLDKDLTGYTWTAGVRGGYVSSLFTVAGHFAYNYFNEESFNWGDYGLHTLTLGLDGQFVIDSNWNLVGGVEYVGVTNEKVPTYTEHKGIDKVENAGIWTGYFGVNYNIDATKYVGAYINGAMNHQGGDEHDEWVGDKGYGFGFKFGVDF